MPRTDLIRNPEVFDSVPSNITLRHPPETITILSNQTSMSEEKALQANNLVMNLHDLENEKISHTSNSHEKHSHL